MEGGRGTTRRLSSGVKISREREMFPKETQNCRSGFARIKGAENLIIQLVTVEPPTDHVVVGSKPESMWSVSRQKSTSPDLAPWVRVSCALLLFFFVSYSVLPVSITQTRTVA